MVNTIQDVLQLWADLGFFDYVLPFLLIFAVVFGVLNAIKIFGDKNKGINAIIAISVGLLSLQFGFVPRFFSEIFPRTGVALAVILIFIILVGLFVDPKKSWIMYILLGIGTIAAIVTLTKTSNILGWHSSYWVTNNWALIISLLTAAVFLIIVIATASGKQA
ncbi:MAG: hypothetical protein AABY22_24265, partial [Nanoarchaeota archaeon]